MPTIPATARCLRCAIRPATTCLFPFLCRVAAGPVVHGGGFSDGFLRLRATGRDSAHPGFVAIDRGYRCAKTAP